MSTPREPSFDSTMVRRGSDASRLSQIAAFAADLERISLPKLAGDLPSLLRLSEQKRALVRQILRRRLRGAADPDRESFCAIATQASSDADPAVRAEIDALLGSIPPTAG